MWLRSRCTLACWLLAIAVAATTVVAAEEDDGDRGKRQTPYYTAALPVRPGPGPTFKPQLQQQQQQQARYPAAAFSVAPHPFRSSPIDDSDADDVDRNAVSPTPSLLLNRPQPTNPSAQYRSQTPQPQQQQQVATKARPNSQDYRRPPPQGQRNQFQQQQQQLTEEELADLEEDEKEEPDRLTQLLPESKFSCQSKNTGYYADEGLNCEVFHYCQDNAKHSWVCPEGFLFHQVHLICMPPSSDNICKQSSQYHFVNDYLYRPINEEEVQRKPNVSLRYADRYYPENYYEEAEESHQPAPQVVRRPVPVTPQSHNYQLQRPVQQVRQSSNTNQVFHSPEEVNIPLQHRRPQQEISQSEEDEY